MFRRAVFSRLWQRIEEPRRFIQILAGPRQTGKTTIARQVREAADMPVRYASADEPTLKDPPWIEQQWESARLRLRSEGAAKALLILDEIQKIPEWSETVKRLWDEDSATSTPLHVVLLGSSPLLTYRGLSDSLAGRFEILPVTHWGYPEMREAFGWSVDQYVYFGGYPGAAGLIGEPDRWRRYILDALIEPSVSRDILLMTRVDKPALLRRLFELGCVYSGRILSYQKMTGQLQDAGNTTTLAHYLHLLQGAGLLVGLHKYAGERVRQRGSSPKLLVMNTALFSAFSGKSFEEAPHHPGFLGTAGRIGGWRHAGQRRYWHGHGTVLLGGQKPGSGLRAAPRGCAYDRRGKKRPAQGYAPWDGGLCKGVPRDPHAACRRGWYSAGRVLVAADRRLDPVNWPPHASAWPLSFAGGLQQAEQLHRMGDNVFCAAFEQFFPGPESP